VLSSNSSSSFCFSSGALLGVAVVKLAAWPAALAAADVKGPVVLPPPRLPLVGPKLMSS
jgi:hypothetical protein